MPPENLEQRKQRLAADYTPLTKSIDLVTAARSELLHLDTVPDAISDIDKQLEIIGQRLVQAKRAVYDQIPY